MLSGRQFSKVMKAARVLESSNDSREKRVRRVKNGADQTRRRGSALMASSS